MRGHEVPSAGGRIAGCLLATMLAGCGHPDDTMPPVGAPEGPGVGASNAVILSGRVVAPGGARSVVHLYPGTGEPVVLAGPLETDLQTLRGARVTVRGAVTLDGAVVVERYAVLEINGERPAVGRVGWVRDDLVILTDQGVRSLAPASAALLRDLVGATVWATGAQVGERLVVTGYGVIRHDPPSPP